MTTTVHKLLLLVLICSSAAVYADLPQTEKDALTEIRTAYSLAWDVNNPCLSSVKCNADKTHVIEINFSTTGNNLPAFPNVLSKLPNLVTLAINGDVPIPNTFWNFGPVCVISSIRLSLLETVPADWGNSFPLSLTSIMVSKYLPTSIPSTIFNNQLQKLTISNGGTDLELPALGTGPVGNIVLININGNGFSLPAEGAVLDFTSKQVFNRANIVSAPKFMSGLNYPGLKFNSFQGLGNAISISGTTFNLSNIDILTNYNTINIVSNALEGPFPSGTLYKSVKMLNLANNLLSGPIPSALCNLPVNFPANGLNLAKNKFTGNVPTCFLCEIDQWASAFAQNNFDNFDSSTVYTGCPTFNLTTSTVIVPTTGGKAVFDGTDLGWIANFSASSPVMTVTAPNTQVTITVPVGSGAPKAYEYTFHQTRQPVSISIGYVPPTISNFFVDANSLVINGLNFGNNMAVASLLVNDVAVQITSIDHKKITVSPSPVSMTQSFNVSLNVADQTVNSTFTFGLTLGVTTCSSIPAGKAGNITIVGGVFSELVSVSVAGTACQVISSTATKIICTADGMTPAPENGDALPVAINTRVLSGTFYVFFYTTEYACTNCSSHGVCSTSSGQCLCNFGWGGLDCNTMVASARVPKAPVSLGSGLTNLPGYDISYNISLAYLREIDQSGAFVRTLALKDAKWTELNSTHIATFTSDPVIVNVLTTFYSQSSPVTFAGESFTAMPNSVKYIVTVTSWAFANTNNSLQVIYQTAASDSCIQINKDPSPAISYEIQADDSILITRFSHRMIVDSKVKQTSISILPSTDPLLVPASDDDVTNTLTAMTVSHFSTDAVLDPNFGLVLREDSLTLCPKSEPNDSWKLPVIIVCAVIGAILLGIAIGLLVKYCLKRRHGLVYELVGGIFVEVLGGGDMKSVLRTSTVRVAIVALFVLAAVRYGPKYGKISDLDESGLPRIKPLEDGTIPPTIFISMGAYRDIRCAQTLDYIFGQAMHPERIFVGLVDQGSEKLEPMKPAYDDYPDSLCYRYLNTSHALIKHNVRRMALKIEETHGPTYARYLASTLYRNETYFMQIDSHIRFIKHWDAFAISDHRALRGIAPDGPNGVPMAVLSTYPKSFDNTTVGLPLDDQKTVPRLCHANYANHNGLITFYSHYVARTEVPEECPFVAAGYFFGPGYLLETVPFDPHLYNLFEGEEITFTIRLWTNGFRAYAPTVNINYHFYGRQGEPKFWEDLKNYGDDMTNSVARVKYILGLNTTQVDLSLPPYTDIEPYDIKDKSLVKAYFDRFDMDFEAKTMNIDKWCHDGPTYKKPE
eukprot:gene3451-3924_t